MLMVLTSLLTHEPLRLQFARTMVMKGTRELWEWLDHYLVSVEHFESDEVALIFNRLYRLLGAPEVNCLEVLQGTRMGQQLHGQMLDLLKKEAEKLHVPPTP